MEHIWGNGVTLAKLNTELVQASNDLIALN